MRVRDLRWYILASIIIIISYAAMSFCYYLSIKNGMVENSMKAIAQEVAEARSVLVQDVVDEYYEMFVSDTDNKKVYKSTKYYDITPQNGQIFEACTKQLSLSKKLEKIEGQKVIMAKDTEFNDAQMKADQAAGDIPDAKFYFYFQKPISAEQALEYRDMNAGTPVDGSESTTLTCRILVDKIFTIVDSAKNNVPSSESETTINPEGDIPFNTKTSSANEYTLISFTTQIQSGAMVYASASYGDTAIQGTVGSFVGDTNYYNSFKDVSIDDTEVKILNKIYKIEGKSSVFTAFQLKNMPVYQIDKDVPKIINNAYIATIIPTGAAVLGSSWVIQQALILFFAGIVVLAAMLVLMVLGTRRASQLLRADRHSTEATKAIVIRIDKTGKVIFTNQTFKQVYGVNRLINVDDFIDVQTNEPILQTIMQNKAFECEIQDSDGETKYLNLSPLYISRSYYLMGTEITQDYNRRKHLEIMSGRNEYTNLENGFMLANQFDSIIENNPGYDIAFVEYNIHKYEEIIGVFGQTSFIALLNEFLKILKDEYPDKTIYHVTDSKFWVVYPNTDINVIIESINKTLEVFQRPITVRNNNIYVNTKIIVYNYKREDADAALLDNSKKISLSEIRTKMDLAYRNIKTITGRDYIIYDPKMDAIILATDEMEKDIEQGLINHEFEMYLQPQFDIVANQIAGFEALIRWHNPKYKDKSPQVFIELAEQRGHMLDIGKFVITESFKLAKKLEPYGVHVSVNVSPVQLLQVGFVQQLIDEFQKLDLHEGSVAVEITETLLMGNFNLVTEKLKILKEKGFSIHLDDFGTGYSSMLYLKDLPVDTIKIDKEFTKHIETNKVSEAIVKTICNLGTTLHLGIICEGVETQIQSDIIKKFGCRVIQGYLIGKAMPYDEAVELIEKYANKR